MTAKSLAILEQTKQEVEQTIFSFQKYNISTQDFCIMPFVNITLEANGEVGICRHKGTKFTFGNLKEKSISEIWQSAPVQEWRAGFRSDDGNICSKELIEQQCNLCPELNKLLPFAEINNIVDPKILRLTANLNGKCNLECPMCDVWQMPNGFYTDENFWIPAREKLFKEILEVDMLSGEPFIQKDTYRLINEISKINPECQWSLTTNLNWHLSTYIKNQLNKIKIKNLIVSIDSLDPTVYKKIRRKGDLDCALTTLDKILKYQEERQLHNLNSLNIRLNFTTQQDNWREIKNIITFCLDKNIIPYLSFLYNPSRFSLLTLSYQERISILEFYFSTLSNKELLFTMRIIKPIIRSLNSLDYRFYLVELQRKTTQQSMN